MKKIESIICLGIMIVSCFHASQVPTNRSWNGQIRCGNPYTPLEREQASSMVTEQVQQKAQELVHTLLHLPVTHEDHVHFDDISSGYLDVVTSALYLFTHQNKRIFVGFCSQPQHYIFPSKPKYNAQGMIEKMKKASQKDIDKAELLVDTYFKKQVAGDDGVKEADVEYYYIQPLNGSLWAHTQKYNVLIGYL